MDRRVEPSDSHAYQSNSKAHQSNSNAEPTDGRAEPPEDRAKPADRGTEQTADATLASEEAKRAFAANGETADVVEEESDADEETALVDDEESDTARQPSEAYSQEPDVDREASIADLFENANPILDDYEFNGTVLAARRWHGLLWAWRRILWWTGLIFLSPAVIAVVTQDGVRSFFDVFPIPVRAYLARDADLVISARFDTLFGIGFVCWLAVVPLRVASAVIEEYTSIKVQKDTPPELRLKYLPGLQPPGGIHDPKRVVVTILTIVVVPMSAFGALLMAGHLGLLTI